MSFNLIKMLLKFSIGHTALSGDIFQFYNVFKLRPQYWHLQLFLFQANLDPSKPVEGMRQLAELVKKDDPKLAESLTTGRFVDDLNDSLETLEAALRLQATVDRAFAKLGVKVKCWAIAGMPPAPEISDNGYVGVAGMAWHAETDSVELKLADLHLGLSHQRQTLPHHHSL